MTAMVSHNPGAEVSSVPDHFNCKTQNKMDILQRKNLLAIVIFLCTLQFAHAQEAEEEESFTSFHRVTLALGHAHVPAGVKENGNKEWLILGAWGLDYDYWFHPKWAVGLHSDVTLENFEVEDSGDETDGVLERSYPFATTLVGVFKPGEHFSIVLGAGGEFAKEGSLFLIRGGLEYGWELPGEWELGISVTNDFKVNTYDSWMLGLGVSKIFGK